MLVDDATGEACSASPLRSTPERPLDAGFHRLRFAEIGATAQRGLVATWGFTVAAPPSQGASTQSPPRSSAEATPTLPTWSANSAASFQSRLDAGALA